ESDDARHETVRMDRLQPAERLLEVALFRCHVGEHTVDRLLHRAPILIGNEALQYQRQARIIDRGALQDVLHVDPVETAEFVPCLGTRMWQTVRMRMEEMLIEPLDRNFNLYARNVDRTLAPTGATI